MQRAVAVALVTFLTLLLLAAGTTAGMYVSGGRELREGVEAQESIIYQGHTYERNDDVVAFMLLGFDGKRQSKGHPGQLDTMIIVAPTQATFGACDFRASRQMVDIPVLLDGVQRVRALRALCLARLWGWR